MRWKGGEASLTETTRPIFSVPAVGRRRFDGIPTDSGEKEEDQLELGALTLKRRSGVSLAGELNV